MTSSRFIVELPQHNSDREGTLSDIKDAIARLKHISNEIFDRIEQRTSLEINRLEALEARAQILRNKISSVASQPSKAFTIKIQSKLPDPNGLEDSIRESLFADFAVQHLGDVDDFNDDHRFAHRRNADQDDDPAVPHDALVEMERRMLNMVASKVREAKEQTADVKNELQHTVAALWSSLLNGRSAGDDTDEEDLGPPPLSLKSMKQMERDDHLAHEGAPNGTEEFHAKNVEYRPRTKEAHQLGLPTSLGGLLPDIAEPSTFLSKVANPSAPLPPLASTSASLTRESLDQVKPSRSASTSSVPPEDSLATLALGASEEPSSKSKGEDETIASDLVTSGKDTTVKVAEVPIDDSRRSLLASIREAKLSGSGARATRSRGGEESTSGQTPAKTVKRPVTLADEMREKLARRQKALSGERDEEEQLAESLRKGRSEQWDDKSSDSGSTVPSVSQNTLLKGRSNGQTKRPREPSTSGARQGQAPFAGLDALLNRELAAKSTVVLRAPPNAPSSSVGDWDDDED